VSILDALRYRLKTVFRRRVADAERAEEMRFHLSLEEMQKRHTGVEPEEARNASRRGFGNVTAYREEVRRMGLGAALDTGWRNVRYAVRSLSRAPGFAFAAVLTLGLGLGGMTAMGVVVDAVLLSPLPVPDPSRVFAVSIMFSKLGVDRASLSDAAFFTLQRFIRSAEHLGVYRGEDVNLSEGTEPERVAAARVSAGFLRVLAAPPLVGRLVDDSDDLPGSAAVVILSEALWRRRFAGDPAIIGRAIRVDGRLREVIGVAPAWVRYPREDVQLWLPLGLDPAKVVPASSRFDVITRLRPSVGQEAAQRDFQQALDRMPSLYPDAGFGYSTQQLFDVAGYRIVLTPLRDDVVGDVGSSLWVLAGAAFFVLLVGCANVATLFLVRAEARRREAAVRAALGAGRSGLVSHTLTEAMVLTTLGAGLGLLLTAAGVHFLSRAGAGRLPRLAELSIGGGLMIAVIALTVVVGLGCGALAVARLWTLPTASVLRSGGRGATGGLDRQRARKMLVATQVALAFTLLAGSGLLARTYWKLRAVQPGFDPTNVLAFRVGLPSSSYPGAAAVARFYQTARDRLAAIPGVRAVGAVSKLPLGPGYVSGNTIWLEDRPNDDFSGNSGNLVFASGDYFEAMGIPVLAGRVLDRVDPDRPLAEVVVSASFARHFWGDSMGTTVVGRRIRFAPTIPWQTIVGVVGDVRNQSLDQPPDRLVYLPSTIAWVPLRGDSAQGGVASAWFDYLPRVMSIVVAVRGDPAAIAATARATIRSLDPTLPLFDVAPMAEVLSASLARTTFTGWMLAGAAGIALLLGILGVYGVVAYTASLRTREIGLRLTLGARPAQIRAMLAGQGMRLVGAGILGGVALTLVLTRSLQTLLFGVERNDPATLIAVGLALGSAAFLAILIPALRAGRVDPAVTLAAE